MNRHSKPDELKSESQAVCHLALPTQSIVHELLALAHDSLAEIARNPASMVTDEELTQQITQKIAEGT